MTSHPPPPWHLHGPAAIVPALVPVARARRFVPPDLPIVPVAPGLTLGGLIAVTYEGDTLAYSELIAWAGIVRAGSRAGIWVSHIWVDDAQSVSGGREIWKLPKDFAAFDTHRGRGRQEFAAHLDGQTLVRMAIAAPRVTVPQPGLMPMISGTEGSLWHTVGRGTMIAGPARIRVDIPPGSPIAELAMRPAAIALSGRSRLFMDAPAPVS